MRRLTGIDIQTATKEDVAGIQQVLYQGWLQVYPNEESGVTVDDIGDRFKERLSKNGIAERVKKLESQPKNATSIVARLENKVIGVCHVVRHADKNQVGSMYVLPEYQRKGVGKKLWTAAQLFFDPTKDTIVNVVPYNKKAIRFYERLGFVDTGKRFTEEKMRLKSGAFIPEMEMLLKARS